MECLALLCYLAVKCGHVSGLQGCWKTLAVMYCIWKEVGLLDLRIRFIAVLILKGRTGLDSEG